MKNQHKGRHRISINVLWQQEGDSLRWLLCWITLVCETPFVWLKHFLLHVSSLSTSLSLMCKTTCQQHSLDDDGIYTSVSSEQRLMIQESTAESTYLREIRLVSWQSKPVQDEGSSRFPLVSLTCDAYTRLLLWRRNAGKVSILTYPELMHLLFCVFLFHFVEDKNAVRKLSRQSNPCSTRPCRTSGKLFASLTNSNSSTAVIEN